MRIGIASDLHFGYAWGSERQEDAFVQGREALEKCLKADVILLPGDIFDSRIPRQEVMDRAMRLLSIGYPVKSDVRVAGFSRERVAPTVIGTPIVAIHGTHERRAKGLTNPVQLLEAAGLCIAVHGDAVILAKGDERVAIHGMGGVPEQYAPDALRECAFQPLPGMTNILVLHQSFKEYVYEDAAFLSIDSLPPGFDLYVNGHVHSSGLLEAGGKRLLHPGSTVLTQMRKDEAGAPKKVWFYDTETRAISSEDLTTPRVLHYIELAVSGSAVEVMKAARAALARVPAGEPKPLVKLKLTGELPPGQEIDMNEIVRGFDGLIVNVDASLEAGQFKHRVEQLRAAQAGGSIDELGLAILEKNLSQAGYAGPNPAELLAVLGEGDDAAVRYILSRRQSP